MTETQPDHISAILTQEPESGSVHQGSLRPPSGQGVDITYPRDHSMLYQWNGPWKKDSEDHAKPDPVQMPSSTRSQGPVRHQRPLHLAQSKTRWFHPIEQKPHLP